MERFFNQIKLYRPVAAHYDKLAANYLASFTVASTAVAAGQWSTSESELRGV